MTESCEMYLKQILILKKKHENIKAIDIAKSMGFSKPSVSNALSLLKEKRLININKGLIELTDNGLAEANNIIEKFETIKLFLTDSLKLDEEVSKINACRMEHIITDSCYRKMIDYIKENIC